MPTYDYSCINCGIETEIIHSIKDEIERKCEQCGSVLKRNVGGGLGFLMPDDATRTSIRKQEKHLESVQPRLVDARAGALKSRSSLAKAKARGK